MVIIEVFIYSAFSYKFSFSHVNKQIFLVLELCKNFFVIEFSVSYVIDLYDIDCFYHPKMIGYIIQMNIINHFLYLNNLELSYVLDRSIFGCHTRINQF
jgi:hypothetical protein